MTPAQSRRRERRIVRLAKGNNLYSRIAKQLNTSEAEVSRIAIKHGIRRRKNGAIHNSAPHMTIDIPLFKDNLLKRFIAADPKSDVYFAILDSMGVRL